jgi:hypothetical protein
MKEEQVGGACNTFAKDEKFTLDFNYTIPKGKIPFQGFKCR